MEKQAELREIGGGVRSARGTRRQYVMTARAESAAQTRERVLRSAMDLGRTVPISAIGLPAIADGAGVSVQTVLRQFGTRTKLLDATAEYVLDLASRGPVAPVGNVGASLRGLFTHYERHGDAMLLILGQESWEAQASLLANTGRALHRRWVAECFRPIVTPMSEHDRADVIELLVAATGIYSWKVLRRDRNLEQPVAERLVLRMIKSIVDRY